MCVCVCVYTYTTLKNTPETQQPIQICSKSSAELQDPRSMGNHQLYFYMLACNNPKNEAKKIIPFTISSKRIKYRGISLTKDM